MHPLPPLSHFPSYISSFGFLVYHLSPAFCSPVPGQPGADWEVKRGTSSPCWIATSSTIYSSSSSILHFIFRFSCLPFIPRLLLTGPGATWCRLGSEERDFVTMLDCNVFYHLFLFIFHLTFHLSVLLFAIYPPPSAHREERDVVTISVLPYLLFLQLFFHVFFFLQRPLPFISPSICHFPSDGSHLIAVLGSSNPSG
ncbi:hypothetical protein N7527_004623 [Penicillium freii]|nr:hypothetical protein N7527_004623 [Penicillium freii]